MKCFVSSLAWPQAGHLALSSHLILSKEALSGTCPILCAQKMGPTQELQLKAANHEGPTKWVEDDDTSC